MYTANETSEHHVDGCSVEDRREEDETALNHVGGDLIGVVVSKYACAVANNLN